MPFTRSLSYQHQLPMPTTVELMDFSEIQFKVDPAKTSDRLASKKKTRSMGNLRHKNQLDQDSVAAPPRPPNAWILYRSNKVKEFKEKHQQQDSSSSSSSSPTTSGGHHVGLQAEVSKIISNMWKSEKEKVKQSYMRMAEERKKTHQEMFPNYKYRPKRHPTTSSKGNSRTAATLQDKSLKPKANLAKAKSFYIDTKRTRVDSMEEIYHGRSLTSSLTPCLDSFNTSSNQIWNTPSSVSSWQSDFIPSNYATESSLDSLGIFSQDQYPQSPIPNHSSSTSSPFRSYSDLTAGDTIITLSPLYLGIPETRPGSSASSLYTPNDTVASSFPLSSSEDTHSSDNYMPRLSSHLSLQSFTSDMDEGDVTVNIHGNGLEFSQFEKNQPLNTQVSQSSFSSSNYSNRGENHLQSNSNSSLPFLSPSLSLLSWQASPTEIPLSSFPSQRDPENLTINSNPFDDIIIHMDGNFTNQQQGQQQQIIQPQSTNSQQVFKSQSLTWPQQQNLVSGYNLEPLSQQ